MSMIVQHGLSASEATIHFLLFDDRYCFYGAPDLKTASWPI